MLALLFALTTATPILQDSSNAYLDARARSLVQQARARRDFADRSIRRYQTVAKERISMGLRTPLRERLFYRRETASRIDWRRGDSIKITILGARETIPVASPKVTIPGDLQDFVPRLAFDPMDSEALITVDSSAIRHPLSNGAEAHYRYRTGDSTTINLGERTIKLVELQVIPRRRELRLINGSFWIDAATHSVVQAVFRLAKDWNLEEDAEEDDREDVRKVPGFLKPIRAELQYITIEFGLMHLRWWMPTLLSAEGIFQMGMIRTPINYERSYTEYQVEGDTTTAPIARALIASSPAGAFERPCRPRSQMNVGAEIGDEKPNEEQLRRRRAREAARDSAFRKRLEEDTAFARRYREAEECSKRYTVVVADSSKLLTAAELPPNIFGDDEVLTTDPELKKIAERLKKLADLPWQLRPPTFNWGLGGSGLVRYNKIEALSVGARTEVDLGRLRLDATGRIGVADLKPRAELGLTRSTPESWLRLAGYRRLNVMDEASRFGGIGTTLSAFFLGNDERDYYQSTGAELVIRPAEPETQWFEARLFAETQRPVDVETEFSVQHLLKESHTFASNRQALRADQAGANLLLRFAGGRNPAGFRWNAELDARASVGTYDFTREAVTLGMSMPLPFGQRGALEVAGGTSTGPVPLQTQWFVGGVRTVRGYDIGEMIGTAFWRGRAEIGSQFPAARLTLFSDVGWAGAREDISTSKISLWSAGVGASFLDGLLRIDLARALRGNTGWRLHASVDGIL
jgi:hypothetical protein